MAKYTTEVRSICETMAGYIEAQGYGEIDAIVEEAAPLIFDSAFPIFDEEYRLPLETKILKHFYTREICEETVGLWKLRLNARMNEIMPYYNQLYLSQLLEFNPFYDVDVSTTHTKDNTGENSENSSGTSESVSVTDTDTTGNKTGKGTSLEESSETTANTSVTDTDTSGKKDVLFTSDKDVYTETQEWLDHTKNNTENTVTANSNVVDRDDYEKNTGTHYDSTVDSRSTLEETVTTDTGDVVVDTSNTGTSANTTTKDGDNWTKYSDTPQGGISGLSSDTYLTNAEHDEIGEEGTSNTSTTDTGKQTTTNNLQGDIVKGTTYAGGITDETTDSTDRTYEQDTTTTDSGSKDVTAVETYNTTDLNTVGTTEGNESSEKTTEVGTIDTTVTDNGSTEKTTSGSTTTTEESIGTIDTTVTTTGSTGGSKTGSTTSLEEYAENIIGKRGTESYSSLLLKFRETFLNIDLMVINDLKDLFMMLW